MDEKNLFQKAHEVVNGQRQDDYGDMNESFSRIAGLWSSFLGITVSKYDVAKMMILLKVSRAKYHNHEDSLVDIIGYTKCIETMLLSC